MLLAPVKKSAIFKHNTRTHPPAISCVNLSRKRFLGKPFLPFPVNLTTKASCLKNISLCLYLRSGTNQNQKKKLKILPFDDSKRQDKVYTKAVSVDLARRKSGFFLFCSRLLERSGSVIKRRPPCRYRHLPRYGLPD